jgi:anti-sigma B factor antagonist
VKKGKKIRCCQAEGTGILFPVGHLTRGHGVRDLCELVDRVLASGRRNVILDLSGVEYLDAAGLGALVRCHRRVAARGGCLVVAGARSKVREILGLADLEFCLEQVEELDEALAALSPSAHAETPLPPAPSSRVA